MTDLTERLRATRLLSQRNQLALQEEAAATLETLTQEKEALRHKLWMVACHATGGGMRDIAGIDQSVNDICVQISASRNLVWAEAQKYAAKDLAQENARLREALMDIRAAGDISAALSHDGDEIPFQMIADRARKALGGGDA